MMMQIPEGTVIIKEGEVNLDMYKIITGNVEVYTGYGTDKEAIIGIYKKGDYFGQIGLLTQKPALYTIVAFSYITVMRITMADIDEYIQRNHTDVFHIMQNMAESMYNMKFGMDLFVRDVAEGRVDVKEKNFRGFYSNQFARYNVNGQVAGTRFEKRR